MKSKGFTLIELLIVIAIVGIIAAISFQYVQMSEFGVICKAGYKFSIDVHGFQQQIYDENGRAIPCN